METKSWYTSKTLWVNFFAFVALVVQQATGYLISPELQGYGLVAANLILRWVTKTGLSG